MELKSYYDFALDDYHFLCELRDKGITANSIGAIAQNTCERFLKHLIDVYVQVTEDNRNQLTEVLSTHNLNKLVYFWNASCGEKIPLAISNQLRKINGFYFSTKYPGDDCLTLTDENIKMCFNVVEICRQTVDGIIQAMESKK